MHSIKDLMLPEKTCEFEYPEIQGFKLQLTYLSNKQIQDITNKSMTKKYSKITKTYHSELNDSTYTKNLIPRIIKGWSGLTVSGLAKLVLVDYNDEMADEEIEYTEDNAIELCEQSVDFTNWVVSMSRDLENFSKTS